MSNARNLANLLGTGTQITTADIADEVFRSNKNIIKNGAMVVAQRATSVTGDTAGGSVKTVDRMNPEMNAAGTWTQSQSTDVPSGQGFVNSFKLDCTTADASLAANDYVAFGHRIEGLDLQRLNYGTSGAKNSVLSFWVKTNKAGNYVVGIQNAITGGTAKNCSFLYTVSSANTWQKIKFPVPADTAAAFDNDANATVYIYWWLAVGSNYNTGTLRTTWTNNVSADFAVGLNVNLADSTDNEWYITGIQWEEGDVATPFEHEEISTTLAKCKRYFEVLKMSVYPTAYTTAGLGNFFWTVEKRGYAALSAVTNSANHGLYPGSGSGWRSGGYIYLSSFSGSSVEYLKGDAEL